jgi:hypothetical protein
MKPLTSPFRPRQTVVHHVPASVGLIRRIGPASRSTELLVVVPTK